MTFLFFFVLSNGSKREREVRLVLVLAVDPLLSIVGVRNEFFRLKPQTNLVFSCLWSVTSMDYVPAIVPI